MSKQFKNTYIEGMDRDSSKSKYPNTKYLRGSNIKLITEDGLSTGNVENEDGNKFLFQLPTIYPTYRIYYTDIENSVSDTLPITYIDPLTNISVSTNSTASNTEDLHKEISNNLNILIEEKKIKILNSNSYITLVLYDSFNNIFNSLTSSLHITVEQITGELSNLKIIGGAYLREEIVIFSTFSDDETPSGTDGQIWKFAFNNNNTDIENINGSRLDSYYHLMYNGKLNFSTYWHIGREAIGHYENSKIGRVYWTDEYNQLRTANLLDPNLLGNLPSTFNIIGNYNTSLPIIKNFGTGNIAGGIVVQYCYRLAKTGGQYTAVSPLTNPCPLGNENPVGNSTSFLDKWGAPPGTYNGHSVTYEIKGIDTSYNVIEHIAVLTNNIGTDIYIFKEEAVPADGTLTVTHSDRGSNIPLTVEEFSFINRAFKRCKTITVKDKRLIVANLDTLETSLDGFDTRAYRFNPARLCKLSDNERGDIDFNGVDFKYTNNSTLDWNDVPEDYDAINPYNLAPSTNDYRFQADGITIGGEGPNIKYNFTIREFEAKDRISGISNGSGGQISIGEGYIVAGSRRIHSGDVNANLLNGEKVLVEGEYFNYKSASMCVNFTGYTRGEIYRFGITFFDKAGNPFNTKWIGDIKFPDYFDYNGGNYQNNFGLGRKKPVGNEEKIFAKVLGINFNIDVSSIKDSISGFEIVRLDRPLRDRSRLGTGLLAQFTRGHINPTPGDSRHNLDTHITFESDEFVVGNNTLPGSPIYYTLADNPSVSGTDNNRLYGFISPITSSNHHGGNFNIKDEDRVRTIDFQPYKYEGGVTFFNTNRVKDTADKYNLRSYIANEICYPNTAEFQFNNNSNLKEVRTVTDGEIASPARVLGPSSLNGMVPGTVYVNGSPIAFASGTNDSDVGFSGFGNQKAILELSSKFNYLDTVTQLGSSNQHMINKWRIVSYERTLQLQYGGNTYESRSNNQYISTGAFKTIKENDPNSFSIEVYGGDTYVQYYPYQYYYHGYTQNSYGIGIQSGQYGNLPVGRAKYNLGVGFLCESPLNIEFQNYNNYASKIYKDWFAGLFPGFPYFAQPTYTNIEGFYNKKNNSKLIHFSKGFLDDYAQEFPHRIWASDKKIDGELFDVWRLFRPNNFGEVEGMYGEINKIVTERNDLLFYQDTAIGTISVNDRTSIPSTDGTSIVLGSGGILDYYKYISRKTGTKHKFSVVPSSTGIHHYDSNLRKWMLLGEGVIPLNDIKGLNSLFKEFNGDLLFDDRLLKRNGVHGIYDRVRNKVYMTFLNTKYEKVNSGLFIPPVSSDDVLTPNEQEPSIGNNPTGSTTPIALPEEFYSIGNIDYTRYIPTVLDKTTDDNYTLSYNEYLQKFESEHSFKPSLYLENSGHLLSTNDSNLSIWEHYKGLKGSYYGNEYTSTLELIINPDGDITKVFDSIEFKSEMFINDVEFFNLSLDNVQILNDHQDSGVIPLVVDGNLKRRFRTWRLNVFRDKSNSSREPRMRDYFIKLILKQVPKYTLYSVNNVANMTNNNRLTLNIPNIGTLKKLKGNMITLTGNVVIQSPNSLYTFNGKYLVLNYNANSITIELPTPINGTVSFQPTNNIIAIINDDRKLILHDIVTNYRYSPY